MTKYYEIIFSYDNGSIIAQPMVPHKRVVTDSYVNKKCHDIYIYIYSTRIFVL